MEVIYIVSSISYIVVNLLNGRFFILFITFIFMKNILKELVEIPSVTGDVVNCKKAIDFVKDIAIKSGLKTKVLEKDGVFTLIMGKEIKKEAKIILNGHLDVVPAKKDMFKTRLEGDRMIGRGTSDMKGGDVAMLLALTELIEEGEDPDVLLIFTTDEEVGGFKGIKLLVDDGFKSDIVFIPDGGEDAKVCTDQKGVFHILFKAKGVSTHGSRPCLGENAVLKLVTVFQRLEKEFKKRWGDCTGDDNWKPTLNLGMLSGGEFANQVPDLAEMKVDIRFPSPITLPLLKNLVNGCLEGMSGIEMEVLSTGSPLHTDVKNSFVRSWVKLFKGNISFVKECGASDGRFFAERDIPVILTKPLSSEPHMDGEWVDLKSLEGFKDTLKRWMRENG